MRFFNIFLATVFLCTLPAEGGAFTLGGFQTPESVVVDPASGMIFVSNINGTPGLKDNNGYISQIGSDGTLLQREFIKGGAEGVTLHAPKGLAIVGDNLYATDIDMVRWFDKTSGRLRGEIDLSSVGAKFLNDLAEGPNGLLFVSDTAANTIFRIETYDGHRVSVLVSASRLGGPNGLRYDTPHHRLVVVTWNSGRILGVDMQGKILNLFPQRFEGLDGVDFDREGNILFSAHAEGKIYRLKNYETLEVVREKLVTPADIAFDYAHNRVLIPSFKGNLVFTHDLGSP